MRVIDTMEHPMRKGGCMVRVQDAAAEDRSLHRGAGGGSSSSSKSSGVTADGEWLDACWLVRLISGGGGGTKGNSSSNPASHGEF
jgi:hypothetical protein